MFRTKGLICLIRTRITILKLPPRPFRNFVQFILSLTCDLDLSSLPAADFPEAVEATEAGEGERREEPGVKEDEDMSSTECLLLSTPSGARRWSGAGGVLKRDPIPSLAAPRLRTECSRREDRFLFRARPNPPTKLEVEAERRRRRPRLLSTVPPPPLWLVQLSRTCSLLSHDSGSPPPPPRRLRGGPNVTPPANAVKFPLPLPLCPLSTSCLHVALCFLLLLLLLVRSTATVQCGGATQKMCCFYLAPDTPTPPLPGSHFCTAIVEIASLLPPTPLRHWVCFFPPRIRFFNYHLRCLSVLSFPLYLSFFAQVYVCFQSSIPIFDFFSFSRRKTKLCLHLLRRMSSQELEPGPGC